jgi:hypothetical protein
MTTAASLGTNGLGVDLVGDLGSADLDGRIVTKSLGGGDLFNCVDVVSLALDFLFRFFFFGFRTLEWQSTVTSFDSHCQNKLTEKPVVELFTVHIALSSVRFLT